ncbi:MULTISPECIES: Fur family transcriptional regulator [Streptococcus]|uniref:Fur family transcriptional regulator n=1 Tax=Streptococcus caledonicus TaxID=2614158 RepID=A0ABW0UFB2_9STRE
MSVDPHHQETYEQVLAHLKGKQIRLTETRKAIIAYMIEAHHHPSAEQIFHDLQDQYTHMSLATVYNNLRILIEEGFVSEVKVSNDNTTYFDFMGHDHLHVVCEICGNITDFMDADTSLLVKEAEQKTGYQVTKNQFLIYGVCPACSLKK